MMRTMMVKKALAAAVAVSLGMVGLIGTGSTTPVGAESPLTAEIDRGLAGVDGEITRLYAALLDREPEPAGHHYWVERRAEGMPLTDMVAFFRTSPEFQQTFGLQVNASTEEWVEFMYVEVLERPSEQSGKDYWVERVDSGLATKEDLIIFFADSVEFRIKTGTGMEGLLAVVDASEAVYASESTYSYERTEASIVGWERTRITVMDGVVSERSFFASTFDGSSDDIEWTEVGGAIGSHDQGAPALTLPELHTACRERLLSIDTAEQNPYVRANESGRMDLCGGVYREPIADASDGDYITIENYVVLGS